MQPPTVTLDVRDAVDAVGRAALRSLLGAVAGADGTRPLSDQAWLAAAAAPDRGTPPGPAAGDGSPGALVLLAWPDPPAPEAAGQGRVPAGGAVLLPGSEVWALEVAVHPGRRDSARSVEERLVRAGVAEAGRRGASAVRLWMEAAPADRRAMAERLGFTAERELLQLRVGLPLAAEVTAAARRVGVRPFVPGRDEPAWLLANNRAFAGHPEQGRWRPADVLDREQEPWFDPAGFLLHEEGARIAAFCWTKVHDDTDPVLGEIYVIGVDPAFQGKGLGRALTVAGLEHLAGRGVPVGMLYVDGSNTAALALYRSLGFRPHHTDLAYRRRVDDRTAATGSYGEGGGKGGEGGGRSGGGSGEGNGGEGGG